VLSELQVGGLEFLRRHATDVMSVFAEECNLKLKCGRSSRPGLSPNSMQLIVILSHANKTQFDLT